jgi:hypothetical protein
MAYFLRFEVQTGKGKDSYKTDCTTLYEVIAKDYYHSIQLEPNQKKRLVQVFSDHTVVLKRDKWKGE